MNLIEHYVPFLILSQKNSIVEDLFQGLCCLWRRLKHRKLAYKACKLACISTIVSFNSAWQDKKVLLCVSWFFIIWHFITGQFILTQMKNILDGHRDYCIKRSQLGKVKARKILINTLKFMFYLSQLRQICFLSPRSLQRILQFKLASPKAIIFLARHNFWSNSCLLSEKLKFFSYFWKKKRSSLNIPIKYQWL